MNKQRMTRPASALSFVILCCAGCVSTSSTPERVNIQAPMPQDVRSVIIQAWPMKSGSMKNVEGLTNPSTLFAQCLKVALQLKQPAWQVELADGRRGRGSHDRHRAPGDRRRQRRQQVLDRIRRRESPVNGEGDDPRPRGK